MDSALEWKSRICTAFEAAESLPEDDILEELAGHAQSMYTAARASGCTHDEAILSVNQQIKFWRLSDGSLRRSSRRPSTVQPPPAFSASSFSGLAQDISYAARRLWSEPRFTLLVILTMTLAIGATTALFSVTHGVLMKALPWPNADRLVVLKETRGGNSPRFGSFTNTTYFACRDQMRNIDNIAAWSLQDVTMSGKGDPERIQVVYATPSLFRVLGVHTIMGSAFTEKDEANPVLVLSQSLWQERFSGSPLAVGSVVLLDGRPHTIVGILNDAVAYPDQKARAWAPMHIHPVTGNRLSMFNVVAAMSAGATPYDVSVEGTARGHFAVDAGMTTMAVFGSTGPIKVSAELLRDALTVDIRQPLIILLVAVGLLFIIATANIGGLQLARATTRRREIAIRTALGASKARIGRQLVVENLLLCLPSGFAGLMLAWWLHRVMPSLLPAGFPRIGNLSISVIVVLFALFASVVASLTCGIIPMLYIHNLRMTESLFEEGSTAVGSIKRSPIARARMAIMIAQVSLSCILLVGGSLLTRSFMALITVDRGYNPSTVLTAKLSLPETLYTPERRYSILDDLLQRLTAVPDAAFASFTSELPLTPGGSTAAMTMKTHRGEIVTIQASPRIVSPQYFSTLGMRIVQGRSFTDSDTQSSQPVAMVNRSFSRQYLEDAALGAMLPMGVGYQSESEQAAIIGVVEDVRYMSSTESTHPEIYYSYLQLHRRVLSPVLTLMACTSGKPEKLAPALRAVVRETDADAALDNISTMEDRMARYLAEPRLYAIVLCGFAAFSLIVAGVGLLGVLSYIVAQRSRELALRMALGARQIDIIRQVLCQGMTVAATGLGIGLLASAALSHFIAAMLYGVTPYDPLTYLTVPIILLSVASAACIAPALRAARLDPIRLLRG